MKSKLSWGQRMQHPNLTDGNHEVKSQRNKKYNCASWAVGNEFVERLLDPTKSPGTIWPVGIPKNYKLETYMKAMATFGYHPCRDGKPEKGFVKIALFRDKDGDFTHAARLLSNGKWSSKLGINEDIEHETAAAISGGDYREAKIYMKRELKAGESN